MKAFIRKTSWKTLKQYLTRWKAYKTKKLIATIHFKIREWNIIEMVKKLLKESLKALKLLKNYLFEIRLKHFIKLSK